MLLIAQESSELDSVILQQLRVYWNDSSVNFRIRVRKPGGLPILS